MRWRSLSRHVLSDHHFLSRCDLTDFQRFSSGKSTTKEKNRPTPRKIQPERKKGGNAFVATEEERKNNKIQGKPSVHCGSGIVGVGRPIFLLFFSALPADIRGGNSGARRGPAATASPAVRVVQLGARKKRRELPLFFVRTSSWVSNGSGRYRNGRDCVSQRLESTHGTGVNCPHSAVQCYRCLFTTFDSL